MEKESKQWIAIGINAILIISFFLYYKFYDELKQISKMIIDAAPSLIFVIGLVLIYSRDQLLLKRRLIKNEAEKSFVITKYDIYFIIFLMFGVFAGIILTPLIYNLSFDSIDLLQGAVGFLSIYFIKKRYFHYKMLWVSREEYAIDMAVHITYYDSMLLDGLSFISALVVVFVPGVIFQNLSDTDVIQALIPLFSIYWINKKYFSMP